MGFRTRNSSVGGKRVLKSRRAKGRAKLTVSDISANKVEKNKRISRRK